MAFAFDLSVLLRKIILDPLNSQAPGGQRRARRNQGAVAPAQAIKIITNNHLRSAKDRNSRKRRSILQAEVVPTIHDDRKMSSFYPIDVSPPRRLLKAIFLRPYRQLSQAVGKMISPQKEVANTNLLMAAGNAARKNRSLAPLTWSRSETGSYDGNEGTSASYLSSESAGSRPEECDTVLESEDNQQDDTLEDLITLFPKPPMRSGMIPGDMPHFETGHHEEDMGVAFLEILGDRFRITSDPPESGSVYPSSYRMSGMYSILESEVYAMRCMQKPSKQEFPIDEIE